MVLLLVEYHCRLAGHNHLAAIDGHAYAGFGDDAVAASHRVFALGDGHGHSSPVGVEDDDNLSPRIDALEVLQAERHEAVASGDKLQMTPYGRQDDACGGLSGRGNTQRPVGAA